MAVSEKELEDQLMEAGNRLLSPPSSVDDLLPLLDELQCCLERVEQSPSKRMLDALIPSINALVANTLLRHLDPDVQVSVATCISEITRITAPDAPYDDDDQMKEILKLIVSSFEKLHDTANRSYNKRASVLETVARVRSCLLMLDLECDTLIVEMFQHFLKSVRDYHPKDVFQSMETIMTLVLEESEDISPGLLSSILFYLKKNMEDVQPIAQKLAEQVLVKCATKVKPYLLQALKLLKISLNDYKEVVANVCQASPVELNSFSTEEVKDTLEESDDSKIPSNSEKKVDVQHPSSKTSRRKTMNVSSPSPSGKKPEEIRSLKVGRGKKKDRSILENAPDYVTPKKEDGSRSVTSSVSDAKSSKQLNQKEELAGKQSDKRRRGKGKSFLEKDLSKTSSEDNAKEYGSPPKSAAKSVNNKSPAMSSKKKRTASGEETEEYGENFLGTRIRVWWPDDQMFYEGRVDSFDRVNKKYKIIYVDGDVEKLNLKKEKWELIKGDADSDKFQGNANGGGDLDASPERHEKMAKTNADSVKNEDKNKANATAVKRGRGRKKRCETKEEDDSPKNTDLVDEVEVVKSEESNKGAVETALGSTEKIKQEASKISSKSKGKSSKGGRGGSKSNSDGTSVKGKAGKKSSPESAKSGETGKAKSPSINTSSKAQKSEGKSGKKRQRGS